MAESEFRRWLTMLVRRVRQDDAIARLARQKAACRANWWLDHEGMWNLRGRFDPATGLRLQSRLAATTETLRHGPAPEGAPDDPLERHGWLQAMALARLLTNETGQETGNGDGHEASESDESDGVEGIVVIDAETLLHGEHPRTILDTLGFDLPLDTIRRWLCSANITPVIVGVDGTRLILGRTTRLANREQRRALRVWYRTCACCDASFDRCQIHHVDWWEAGGATNITNLLPLCPRHHHLAHEGRWRLELHPDRSLTVIEPNGTRHHHAPPRARAA